MSSTPSSPSTWWSSLSIYARAGLVIGCILAILFILSTAVLCIVRRGRLITTTSHRRRGPSVPKHAYRSPPAPDKEFTHSATVEVRDRDGGEGAGGDAGQTYSGLGVGAPPAAVMMMMPPVGEEVALQEYDERGRGYGYEYEYGYGYAHGYGDGERGDTDRYARDESREREREREQRTWNAV